MIHPLTTTLDSGLIVIRVPIEAVHSITTLVLCNTGSRYERPEQQGIAHFFEHMVFKGTESYPDAHSISSTIDSIGAEFNAFTSNEYTGYYVKSAAEHVSLSLDVLSDMMLKPQLRQDDIDREKGVIVEEINMYQDNPRAHISNRFDNMVFAGSGLGHDIIGSKETVTSFTSKDFQEFLKTWYGLQNMIVVVAGKAERVESDELLSEIEEQFGKKPMQQRAASTDQDSWLEEETPLSEDRFLVEYRETEQAHFILGFPAFRRDDEDRYALSVLSALLGGNMSSRLFTEVREKRGLCYYVGSSVDQYHDGGVFYAQAGVDPNRVDEAIQVTFDEFLKIANGEQPITEDEIQRSKDYTTGNFVLSMESARAQAQYVGMKQLLYGEIETPDEVIEKIHGVSMEDLQRVMKRIIDANQVRFGIIGPFEDTERFRELLE